MDEWIDGWIDEWTKSNVSSKMLNFRDTPCPSAPVTTAAPATEPTTTPGGLVWYIYRGFRSIFTLQILVGARLFVKQTI